MISSVYCYRSSTTPRQNTSLFPEFNGNLGSVPPTLPLTVTNLLTSPPRHWAVAPRLAMSQWRKCHTTPLPGGTKLCRNIATPKQLHSGQPYPDSPATSRQRRRCHRQLPAKSPRHHHSIRTSGSQLFHIKSRYINDSICTITHFIIKIILQVQVIVCRCPGTNCHNSWGDAICSQTTTFLSSFSTWQNIRALAVLLEINISRPIFHEKNSKEITNQ